MKLYQCLQEHTKQHQSPSYILLFCGPAKTARLWDSFQILFQSALSYGVSYGPWNTEYEAQLVVVLDVSVASHEIDKTPNMNDTRKEWKIKCESKKVGNISSLVERSEQCGCWEEIPVLERAREYNESYNIQPSPIALYISDYYSTILS